MAYATPEEIAKTADIETFARNYFASQGKDFDTEFRAFKETYGLK